MKKKIAIFFNSERGFKVFIKLKNKFLFDIYLCQKNLNKDIKSRLKKEFFKFKLVNKISTRLINTISSKKYFLIISAGCPYIFPQDLIDASKKGTINLHAGSLPKYRGGSPLNWQIINGEKKLGISVIKMTRALDAGPIYSQKKFLLHKNYTIKHAHSIANYLFPKMTLETIKKIERNINPKQQHIGNFKIYKQRKDSDGLINWKNLNSMEVVNFVRGISKPYPGAFFFHKGKKVRLYNCQSSKLNPELTPGTVFAYRKKKYIKCKINSIKIKL